MIWCLAAASKTSLATVKAENWLSLGATTDSPCTWNLASEVALQAGMRPPSSVLAKWKLESNIWKTTTQFGRAVFSVVLTSSAMVIAFCLIHLQPGLMARRTSAPVLSRASAVLEALLAPQTMI